MINPLFSTNIYKTKFNNIKKLESICESDIVAELVSSDRSSYRYVFPEPSKVSSNLHSWHDNFGTEKLHATELFSEITQFVESHAKIYWDNIEYYNDVCPKIYQSWITKYHHGGFIDKHDHIPASISAVLYLSASPEQGNVVFENPLELWLRTQPYSADKLKGSFFEQEIPVATGDLILFPSYLRHWTQPNRSQKDRIIMSFNLCYRMLGIYRWPRNKAMS